MIPKPSTVHETGATPQSFLYGRAFSGDADLNAQVLHWLATVANVRDHGTTHEPPTVRFERDERVALQPLAAHPYRSLVLLPDTAPAAASQRTVPRIPVERRPLTAYAALAAGTR